MADEINKDTPTRTEEEDSDSQSGSGSGSGSGSESEDEQTELLVNTREKRSTAGNRLTSLLQQEEADDELELLFAEDDDDAGYEDEAADSDVQMDSSDDDDDQGPAAGAEDLEGEKELQRQARAEKLAKKKKLGDGIPIFKKKVKIDPTAVQAPAPRPKKKSERASWIPTADDAPTRASKRKSTKQSKEQLMAQMVDREIKRVKQLETMEKAQAAKEAARKPAMTQADRLAEAARVEKRNAKSLSRWEEAEQQREEEQLAKLAALSNRHLEGPVITLWSGMATWVGGTLKKVGKSLELEDPKEKQSKKRKAAEMEADSAGIPSEPVPTDQGQVSTDATEAAAPDDVPPPINGQAQQNGQASAPDNVPPPVNGQAQQNGQASAPSPAPPTQPLAVPPTLDNKPSAEPPKVSSPSSLPSTTIPTSQPASESPQPPPTTANLPPANPPQAPKPPSHPPFILAPPQQYPPPPPPPHYYTPSALDGSSPLPGFRPPPLLMPSHTTPFAFTSQTQLNLPPPTPPTPPPPGPPPIEYAARNYVILANFNEEAIKDKHVQTTILIGRKFVKSTKSKIHHELCAVTSQPARFRDPHTGLPYRDSKAYRVIQGLQRQEYRWSKLVGAWVGLSNVYAAKGVPPRFLDPQGPRSTPPTPVGHSQIPPPVQPVTRAV